MTNHSKPKHYDGIETQDCAILVTEACNINQTDIAKSFTFGPRGLEICRSDGVRLRFINIPPRLENALRTKPTYVIETKNGHVNIFPAKADQSPFHYSNKLPDQFYWYIGPETETKLELARKPFTQFFQLISQFPLLIAAGHPKTGPNLGICKTNDRFISVPKGRLWEEVVPGVIIDHHLLTRATSGYPVSDDILETTRRALTEIYPAETPPRPQAWPSQISIALPPNTEPN